MLFRFRAFGLHLLGSLILLSSVLGALYVGWYYWPGWYLVGAETVVGVLVLVDVGVGPLATLMIANPAKPRRELAWDITLIAVVQLVALGYGAHTLWNGRPLFYTFSLDRIEIVTAADFDDEVIEHARKQGAKIMPDWMSRPMWVWAPLPEDPELRASIIRSALMGGHDVTSRPEHFRPLAEGATAMREHYVPVGSLVGPKGLAEAEYRGRMADLELGGESVGALLMEGRTHDGAMIFDRASGEPLAFWPVRVDPAAARKRQKSE